MVKLNGVNETQGIIEAVYEACARRNQRQPRRTYLGMSQIGDPCERKLWLDFNAETRPAVEGRLARIFDNGNAVEERVVADLIEAGYKIDGRQLTFSDFDGRFGGHCDGVIHGVTREPHILEIKSANHDSFLGFQRHGLAFRPVYAGQVQCYMGYAGLRRALFVVEDKNNQALYMERVHFKPDVFETLRAKAWTILNLTAPPAGRKGGCDWCDHDDGTCLEP